MSPLLKFVVTFCLGVLASTALACLLPHAPMPATQPKMGAGDWVGPAVSGTWFDPARDGEGILVEMLPNGTAIGTWFTYPASGEAADQAWLSLQNGVVSGDTIRFLDVFRPRGASFGAGFNPADVVLERWGTLQMRFVDCNTAELTYAGPAAFGSGARTLVRLTTLDELECSGAKDLTPSGARALTGLRAKSGVWFVPSRNGEGWFIEELPNGSAAFFWFTFTPDGKQAWITGVAARNGNRLEAAQTFITRGTRFGTGFSASDVQRVPWGRLDFEFSDCNNATTGYASTLEGYGSGTRQSTRITLPASAVCIDGTPVAKTNGTWRQEATSPPAPQSEHAAAVLDGSIYTVGGFGDPRGFKRYDPVSNSWTELPDLPGGRDHLAAFALNGQVFASGGSAHPGGDTVNPGFRFVVATNQWHPVSTLPFNFGSHAAVLNGRGYIGNEDGSVAEFDPSTLEMRWHGQPPGAPPRDHSQVVAFLGEIWMIGGRFPETPSVMIYDPVGGRWRNGPGMARARGGFAAAVVGDQIIIGGGEVLEFPARVEPSVEIYTAGKPQWQFAANLPVPVHGVTGSSLGGRFYLIGGARQAAGAGGADGRTFSIEYVP